MKNEAFMPVKCSEKNSRIVYFDILNILSIVAVIALHCNGIVHNFSIKYVTAWSTSLIVECIFYWAVPVFLMLSGANLMKYRERYSTLVYFKKRFIKIVIPFIFWASVMLIWKKCTGQLKIDNMSVKTLLNIFFSNKEENTYYFIFLILGIYITIPTLSILAKEEYRTICWYTVYGIFITQSVLPIVLKLLGINYNNLLSIQIGGYIIFVLLGYLLSTQNLTKKQRIELYCLAILSIFFRYSMTYFWTLSSNKLNKTLFGYTQFHSVLLATGVFVFIKNIRFNYIITNDKIKKIISDIAGCSFGIYLIHMIVKYYEILIFNINIYSWQWRTLGIITTYLISLAIVYVLKKIPIVRKIVP